MHANNTLAYNDVVKCCSKCSSIATTNFNFSFQTNEFALAFNHAKTHSEVAYLWEQLP